MRFHHAIVTTLALSSGLLFPSIDAFTNGLYLPSYLCGPAIANPQTGVVAGAEKPTGFPKALGGVLAQFVEFSVGVEGNAYNAAIDPKLWVAVMHSANTQAGLTPFGGTNPFAESLVNGVPAVGTPQAMNAAAIMTAAQTNILHVGSQLVVPTPADQTAQQAALGGDPIPPENVIPASTGTTINPNQLVTLTVQSQNNVLGAAAGTTPQNIDQFAAAVAAGTNPAVLDGAIVYAQDANNNRVGHFTTGGNKMAVWAACGGDRSGIVHTTLLSGCTNTYTGPQFFLPYFYTWKLGGNAKKPMIVNGGASTITFMGAAASDNGFGYHQTAWTVQPLADLAVDTMALNKADVKICQNKVALQNSPACLASCYDCIKQAGSTKKVSVANMANVVCAPVPGTGDPMTQQVVWSATCTINGAATPVVPAGTLPVQTPTTKDATGNDVPLTADQQADLDALNAQIIAIINGTSSTNSNPQSANQVNTATTTHTTWFSTITLAVGALVAALRQ